MLSAEERSLHRPLPVSTRMPVVRYRELGHDRSYTARAPTLGLSYPSDRLASEQGARSSRSGSIAPRRQAATWRRESPDVRVHVIGAFTPANLGDGAIISRMINEAQRVFGSGTEVTISATDPRAFEDLIGVPAGDRLLVWSPLGSWRARLKWLASRTPTMIRLWLAARSGRDALVRASESDSLPSETRAALCDILRADVVLAAGGGYLADLYRKQFPFWYLEYVCTRASGTPLIFFSQSFGPAEKLTSRFFLTRSLGLCSAFIARDNLSAARVRKLVPKVRSVIVCPDVAFTTPRAARMSHTSPTLGVSLLRWANYEGDHEASHLAYLEALLTAIDSLLRQEPDLHVRLYATNHAVGRNVMDDVAVCEGMRARLAAAGWAERCSIAQWTPHPEEFAADVAGCELLVASRMHAAVLALTQNVPVAGIAYEEKMTGMLGLFGLEKYSSSIEDPVGIEALVRCAWDARSSIRDTVSMRLPTIQADARSAMTACKDVVDSTLREEAL